MNLKKILHAIQPVEHSWIQRAKERTAQLVMPTRALGRLHDIAERLCGIQKTLTPCIDRKAVLVMAGDHGVVAEGVSAYPQTVTGAMVQTFLIGGAGINAIAGHVQADVWVVDMGIIPDVTPADVRGNERLRISKIGKGTANFAQGPAMSREMAENSIIVGFQHAARLFQEGIQILGTGDMGIGNTTSSAAIAAAITGADVNILVGRGTGVDDDGLQRKQKVIRQSITFNQPNPADGLDVLSKVGGFEIGGIAGAVLAGAFHNRAVVIDGFISTAGALIAHALCPCITDYLFAGHCSAESGHSIMLRHLNLEPILDLGMRLGEGTGAALAMGIMQAAVKVFTDVLTFEQAGVAGNES